MTIELMTEQQRQIDAATGGPTEVIDSRGQRRYMLVPEDEYDALRDDRDQAALRQTSLQNLASRLQEEA